MKKLFTAIAAITIIQSVAIALLLLRARRQDERIVAASSTIIAQLQYVESLRNLYYGKSLMNNMMPSMINEVNGVHENAPLATTWYTWIRAYGYGSKRVDNTPDYPPESLQYIDLLALPNYPKWVDDANFASDSSRYAFGLIFDEYVASSKFAGHLKFLEAMPRRNFGKAAKFNLPEAE